MADLIINESVGLSARDFQGLRESFFEFAQSTSSDIWTDFNEGSFAAAIAEIIAYTGDNLHYYIDRQTQDCFLSTTRDRQAAIDLAALINYFPAGPSPSTGEITLTFDTGLFNYGSAILSGFQVSNGAGIIFETAEDVTVPAASPSFTFDVIEGETIRETNANLGVLAVGDGTPSQSYVLARKNIIVSRTVEEINDNQELVVTVAGELYLATSTLSTAQSTDKVYTLRVSDSGESTITFGNGEFGVIPPEGSLIEATYRVLADEETRALQNSGNVNSNTITTVITVRTGVTGVNNDSQTTGGSPKESLEEIKINAPASLSALNRAVSLQDFRVLANTVTGVAKAVARAGEDDLDVVIHIAPDGGGFPSSTLKADVISFFDDKKMAKTQVFTRDPIYQNVSAQMRVFVEDTFKQSEVLDNITTAIENLFDFENMDFGRPVLIKSTGFDNDLYDLMESLESVQGISKISIDRFTLKPSIYAIRDLNEGSAHMSVRGTAIRQSSKSYEWKLQMDTDTDYILQRSILGTITTLNDTTITDSTLDLSLLSGTSTDAGVSFLQDSSQAFETDEFAGKTLVDAVGTSFLIVSNTIDTITVSAGTPADGAYTIVERLVGQYLVPNVLRDDQFKILSNGINSITIDSGLGAVASAGNSYRIYKPETNQFGVNPLANTAPATTGTITSFTYGSGTLSIVTDSALATVFPDDAFNGYQFIITDGAAVNELTTVIDYNGTTGTFTLGTPHTITTSPTNGDAYICSPKYIMGQDSFVDDGSFSPTTTEFESSELVGFGNDYFNGAVVTFTSGAQSGKSRKVNDYVSATGHFTIDDLPGAPADGDTFEVSFNYEDDDETIVFSTVKDADVAISDEFFFRTSELVGDVIPSEIQILQIDSENDLSLIGVGGSE